MPNFANINGTDLHYSYQEGEGTTVVFSNSLGTDFRIWDGVLDLLPANTPTLRIDKRGHGLSPIAPVTIKDLAEDTAALMDANGIKKAVISGVSVGGLIAQQLATLRPDLIAGLVLQNTAMKIGTDEIWNPRIDTARAKGMDAMADATMERWFSDDFRTNRQVELSGFRTLFANTNREGYARVSEAIRDCDLRDQASNISAPTICVAGSNDLATPPEGVKTLANAIPDATYLEIESVGHLPCIEKPEEIAGAIRKLL